MFVTRRESLAANIGENEAASVFATLDAAENVTVVDLPSHVKTAEDAGPAVRAALNADKTIVGVVILGGFDVVPAHPLDVLDLVTRRQLTAKRQVGRDADNFIVWSDELYADRDGDFLPELPVSRIPDGRRPDVVFGALQAPAFSVGQRFGVHNIARPFARQVFPLVPGGRGGLEVSELYKPSDCPRNAAAGAVYFMLHGDHQDAGRFWGENQLNGMYEAIVVGNVPNSAPGTVVFAGCCWGALSMAPPAGMVRDGTTLRPRSPESSIAVAYLRAGAVAFVGCTGTHYSPDKSQPNFDFLGKPMHDAFWSELATHPPAEALFRAKQAYLRGMPHGLTDPFDKAAEMKILRQFTCLGLGW